MIPGQAVRETNPALSLVLRRGGDPSQPHGGMSYRPRRGEAMNGSPQLLLRALIGAALFAVMLPVQAATIRTIRN